MKRVLPIAFGLLLCHCGTEVGNGIAPEPKREGQTQNSGTPTSAPEAAQDSAAPGEKMSDSVLSTAFIAACASPFAEKIAGTFVNGMGQGFTVTEESNGRKTVARLDGSTLFVITAAPGAGTYAIEALIQSPQVTCSTVTTQTLSDGSLQRSVTLSDGSLVQWSFTLNEVSSLKLTTPSKMESWSKRQ
jgi:hypothetical protein